MSLLLSESDPSEVVERGAGRSRSPLALGKGRDYDRLPETYVAFICTGDFLGAGEPVSTLDVELAASDAGVRARFCEEYGLI